MYNLKRVPEIGTKINRWTVLSAPFRDGRNFRVTCDCECGTRRDVMLRNLNERRSKSCGCLKDEKIRVLSTRHNKSGTRVYRIWNNMLNRCRYKNSPSYPNYGGRGIKVCKEWTEFSGFYSDMGDPPTDSHEIDRVDVNGHYEPSNCRWVTKKEQLRNKTNTVYLTVDGERLDFLTACDRCGVTDPGKIDNVRRRIYRGWGHKEALLAVPGERRRLRDRSN